MQVRRVEKLACGKNIVACLSLIRRRNMLFKDKTSRCQRIKIAFIPIKGHIRTKRQPVPYTRAHIRLFIDKSMQRRHTVHQRADGLIERTLFPYVTNSTIVAVLNPRKAILPRFKMINKFAITDFT